MEKNLRDSELYEDKFRFKERQTNIRFYGILLFILAAVMAFHAYWTMTFGGVTVSGSSMRNTLQSGEQLLMKRVDGEDAERGQVIVVYVGDYPEFQVDDTEYLIKRLIAVGGDHVKCEDGQIYLKYGGVGEWQPLYEPYAYYTDRNGYDFGEYVLQKDEVFFLGDNRNHSQDSRYKEGGSRLDCLFKADDIIGVVPQWAIYNKGILEKLFFWKK